MTKFVQVITINLAEKNLNRNNVSYLKIDE